MLSYHGGLKNLSQNANTKQMLFLILNILHSKNVCIELLAFKVIHPPSTLKGSKFSKLASLNYTVRKIRQEIIVDIDLDC